MTTAIVKKKTPESEPSEIGPECTGRQMTPRAFDRADFEAGWRYELINGVLVVSPIPLESEVGPNDELGHWLWAYQNQHPQGSSLDASLPERTFRTGRNRRRVDRCIWAGLGRFPMPMEKPTVAVEFVSSGKRNRERDYVTKRREFMRAKVKEYWIIDRFDRCMVVFSSQGGKIVRKVVKEHETYTTPLLPGFELPLTKLLKLADKWAKQAKKFQSEEN